MLNDIDLHLRLVCKIVIAYMICCTEHLQNITDNDKSEFIICAEYLKGIIKIFMDLQWHIDL